jgi:2-dehydropantoate 2-reductase
MRCVLGGGSVGLALTSRFVGAGHPTLLIVRTGAQAGQIAAHGLCVENPRDVRAHTGRPDVAEGIEAAGWRIADGPVWICTRASDTDAVADALARVAPGATVVSVQNDVDNECRLARRFRRVIGAVYRPTCTRIAPNRVRTLPGGRMVVGAHPEGGGTDVEELAADLRRSGYDVGVSERIYEDKWLKLCVNLMSAPNALVRREDHTSRAFVEGKERLLEGARGVLLDSGIVARSCDGRDRSLDEEILHQRSALRRGGSARAIPLYNHVWTALRHRAPLEADRYHRRILELAHRHGIAVPTNQRVLDLLEDAARRGSGPERIAAAELLAGC